MYADNTLTPKEAIRLCALGTLARGPMRYDELANAIRHFVSRITGPSLELMGDSIELLKYEGLVAEADGDEALRMTAEGEAELRTLLAAGVRPGGGEVAELILALKVRFLHLLPPAEQLRQADMLAEACEIELARLEDLRDGHAEEESHLVEWIAHDIAKLEARRAWLAGLRERLAH